MRFRNILSVCAALAAVQYGAVAGATPPNAIHANYDAQRGELNVIVEHLVNDPREHYVNEVVISKSGREAVRKTFDFQTSHRNLTIPPIALSASEGEQLGILALCKEGGRYEITIEVGNEQKVVRPGPIGHVLQN